VSVAVNLKERLVLVWCYNILHNLPFRQLLKKTWLRT
jgi:hypothetical protein